MKNFKKMNFLMFQIFLGVVSVLSVYSMPTNFDEFLLSEMIKREREMVRNFVHFKLFYMCEFSSSS